MTHHWTLSTDDNQMAWLTLDKQEASANVLSHEVMNELSERLDEVIKLSPKAMIISSAKKNGFIAGADIKEFTALKTEEEAHTLIRNGQLILDRIEALPFTTIALIHGFALGGGMELALACDYRIADQDTARLGLPEVKLGIHPGFGGTVRSVRVMKPTDALTLMLTGRTLYPKQAKAQGLVDQIVPTRHLKRAATAMALKPPTRKQGLMQRMQNWSPVRQLLAPMITRQTAKKARKAHYPAPFAIIDLWRDFAHDPETMMAEEARSISRLMMTPTSRNLVRVFMLQDELKNLAKQSDFKPRHVHVVGAGVMGGDIAAWCALRGLNVTLQDREAKYLAPAMKRAQALFKSKLREKHKIQAALDRLQPDIAGDGVARADVVIEAIFENVEAKQALFATIEPKMKPDAVLATNTSSLKLENLRTTLERPERLIGLHFFNPVAKMPLLEVIEAKGADPEMIARGMAFAKRIDRLPVPCKSAPGFVVNRVLMPYMLEAVRMLEEGISKETLDEAARQFGMPMGPIELADTVGLDVAKHVAKVFEDAFDITVPNILNQKVEQKQLGRKTGQGFYRYKKGKPIRENRAVGTINEAMIDRMMLPLLNESVALLREGVVANPNLLDAAVIFGTGYAPFRGGPIHTIQTRGAEEILSVMRSLAATHGDRFEPDAGWSTAEDHWSNLDEVA